MADHQGKQGSQDWRCLFCGLVLLKDVSLFSLGQDVRFKVSLKMRSRRAWDSRRRLPPRLSPNEAGVMAGSSSRAACGLDRPCRM